MKATNDLEFLSSYWIEAKAIAERIKEELPVVHLNPYSELNPEGKMFLIPFSELNDKWGVEINLKGGLGRSEYLEALADKIEHMILRGRAKDVEPMVSRIINRGVVNLRQPNYSEFEWVVQKDGVNEKCRNLGNIGKGHFRWNHRAYTLNKEELERLRIYFKL
jgi:hypothetical protein